METLRQVGGSLLLAAFSLALVIGGISLALAESYVPVIPSPTQTQAQVPVLDTPTSQVIAFITPTAPLPSSTVPPPSACPPPPGWIAVAVQSGEDLGTLALRHKSTLEDLLLKNCLISTDLPAGSILYVPPLSTSTVVSCGRPNGWIAYTVRPGNTLYSISHAYGVSVAQLQFANCIPSNSYTINVGQTLWVPNVAVTRTPLVTATASLTPVSIIFPTLTLSATPTATATLPPTATQTRPPTATPTASLPPPTASPVATVTITSFPAPTTSP